MIIGIGLDMVEISRIERSMQRPGFARRCFTEAEQQLFAHSGKVSDQRAAGNFAVKEALSKAMGVGISGCPLNQVEVLRNELGAPYVQVYGVVEQWMQEHHVKNIFVSITNLADLAAAQVVLEGEE